MKYKLVSFSLVVFVFLLSAVSMGAASTATTPKYAIDTKDQCSVPSTTQFITGVGPDRYNISSFNEPIQTCVKIDFHNGDVVDHSFTIDGVAKDNITYFNIFLHGGQTHAINFWTGNANATIQYYCAVPGHRAKGMYGTLNIGAGSSSSTPGFGIFSALVALGMVLAVTKVYKRKR